METQTSMDRIGEEMREPLRRYVRLVRDVAGDNAKALTLYGAIATEWFDPSLHFAQSVLVVDRVDLFVLRKLAQHGGRLGRDRISSPLIMTPRYIASSLDTFPLEFLEIHQNHTTAFGADYFGELAFDDGHIRQQCERELKVAVLSLYRGLLGAAGRIDFMEAVVTGMGDALTRTLYGLLWLSGVREARRPADALTGVEGVVGRTLPGIREALDPQAEHDWHNLERLHTDVITLKEFVDAW